MSERPRSGAPVQLVIFDLMGTLIVDDGVVDAAYLAALRQAGISEGDEREKGSLERIGELRGRPTLVVLTNVCLLYTSPSPRDRQKSRMPSSA